MEGTSVHVLFFVKGSHLLVEFGLGGFVAYFGNRRF